uniref:Integrase catalytic domain-containing protein n=1 Tax=Fagus sylvatica TaxID=28930 RepID=A0A2N9F7W8_FAGSY
MDFAYQGKNPPTKLAAMANASNLNITQGNNDTWLTDSGASDHITANLNNLNQLIPFKGPEQVSVGNGQNLPIQNIGNTQLHTKLHHFRLRNVFHVPRIASNLLSVHKLCLHNNCSCYFDSNKLLVQDLPTGRILYQGQSENGVYPIHSSSFLKSVYNKFAFNSSLSAANNWLLWHTRLGHPSASILHSVFPSLKSCNPLNNKSHLLHCQHCLAGKMHKLPFPTSVPKSEFPLHVLHVDLWGPAPIQSYNGFKYYLVIVDDYTKFCWVYLLKNKSDTFTTFQQFKAMAEKHYNSSIHFLRTDCGGEFTSTAFNSYCANSGIIHHLTCPHTPQQNGVAERKHRHLIQTTLALLSQSGLSLSYWSYALATASHLINKLPTPLLNMSSPWEQLHNVKPNLSYLKTFGCKCFPLLTPYNTYKLQPKTTSCIFLGYPPTTKGYLCQDPITKSYFPNHSAFVQTLNPNTIIDPSPHTAIDIPTVPTTSSLITFPLNDTSQSPAPNSTFTQSPVPNFAVTQSSAPNSAVTPAPAPNSAETPAPAPNSAVTPSPAPISVEPAQPSPLPTPIPNTHPMQTRSKHGIFKPKTCYKAQLDYTLIEPPSFKLATQISQWCQAMQDEYDSLIRQVMRSIARYKARLVAKGFHQQQGIDFDETFSLVIKPPTVRMILSLAVSLNWPLRQLDVAQIHLWPQIGSKGLCSPATLPPSLTLSFNISAPSLSSRILDPYITFLAFRLSLHDGEKLHDPHAYRSLVGALNYLSFTRPDLSFAVHQMCQYIASPTSVHLITAKRILRYLKGTLHLGLSFRPGPLKLYAFTDADWAGDLDDRRSTSGLLVYLGPNPITWSAKKQLTCVSLLPLSQNIEL